MSETLLIGITVFILAVFVGIEVISKVPATLHTPLMSGTNAIHGIVLVGAMLIAAAAAGGNGIVLNILAFVAVILGTINVVGGFVVTDNGVTIVAPDNLPATMPAGASAFYARNISALLLGMVKDGSLNLDFEDEVTKSTVITKDGAVVSEPVKKLLEPAPPATGGNA